MKKLFILIGITIFAATAANAQLKYQNGVLSFGGTAVSGAATTWRGGSHVFTNGSSSGEFWIKPSSNKMSFGTESNQIAISQDGVLSFDGTATTWKGSSHVFTDGSNTGAFLIKPGTTGNHRCTVYRR